MAKLKYNINSYLAELPTRITISDICDRLRAEYDITYDTFNRDRKIELNSKTSIPSDRLQVYAGLFDCTIDELINNRKKIKPLIKVSSVTKRLGIKTKKV